MSAEEHVITGFARDADVLDVLQAYAEPLAQLSTGLITCVDSTRFESRERVQRLFVRRLYLGRCLEYGFAFGVDRLAELAAADEQYFVPFGELWLWERGDQLSRPPASTTSETPFTDYPKFPDLDSDLQQLRTWMVASGCVLGLGDGCGLNYITTDADWDARLRTLG